MKIFKTKELSIPHAIIISALIIGLSMILSASLFSNNKNTQQKPFVQTPPPNTQQMNAQKNAQEQQKRMLELQNRTTISSSTQEVE